MKTTSESKRQASGRRVSIIEGFVQTIGINMGGIYMPNFILTAFLLQIMHASHTLIGFATSIQFFVGLLQPLANVIVHRVKVRRVMVAITSTISRLLFAAAIFYGMYNSGAGAETVFMIILLIGAFSMSFSSSGWSTWMADIVPEQQRGRYFAMRNSVCSVAGILAILAGGWLLKNLPGAQGFSVIYIISAFAAVTGGVILLFQYETPAVEHAGGSMISSYKEIFKDKNFMAFVSMVIFFNLALVLASPFFNVHFLEILHIPLELMAIFTALAAITGILGNIFFGKLSDILGNRLIIRICLLMLIIPTVLILFIPRVPLHFFFWGISPRAFVLIIILLQSFFGAGWNLAVFNTSLSISPRGKRSLYIGVYNSLIAVSAVIAPILGGLLIDLFKFHPVTVMHEVLPATFPVFVVSAILLLIGLIAFPFYREGGYTEDYSLRDVVMRFDFPEIIYKLFVSTFVPRIGARHKLAEDIADLRSPAAIVPLGRLLRDMDPDIRLSALEGLGRSGADSALEVLLEFFPQAGVLEKIELMKSLGNFTTDAKVLDILLEETRSSFPTLRIRALHSLRSAAKKPKVRNLAMERLQREYDNRALLNTIGLVEEEYLAYLELATQGHNSEALTLSRDHYLDLKDPLWPDRFLNAWSHVLGIYHGYYRFLSLEQDDDRQGALEEAQAAAMESLIRCPAIHEVHGYLKRLANEYRGRPQEFFLACERPLTQALAKLPPATLDFILWLLHKSDRTLSEEVLMLMAIRHYTSKHPR